MRKKARLLSVQQRNIFDEIYNWCKRKCKKSNFLTKAELKLFNTFISDGVGFGKYFVIKAVRLRLLTFIQTHQKNLQF